MNESFLIKAGDFNRLAQHYKGFCYDTQNEE